MEFGKFKDLRMKDVPTWYISWLLKSRNSQIRKMAKKVIEAKSAALLDPNILESAEKLLAEWAKKIQAPKPKPAPKPEPPEVPTELSVVERCKTDLLYRYRLLTLYSKRISEGVCWQDRKPYQDATSVLLRKIAPHQLILPEEVQPFFDRAYAKLKARPEKYHHVISILRAQTAGPESPEETTAVFDAFIFKLSEFDPTWQPLVPCNPPGTFKNPIKREPATGAITLVEHTSITPERKVRKLPRIYEG